MHPQASQPITAICRRDHSKLTNSVPSKLKAILQSVKNQKHIYSLLSQSLDELVVCIWTPLQADIILHWTGPSLRKSQREEYSRSGQNGFAASFPRLSSTSGVRYNQNSRTHVSAKS